MKKALKAVKSAVVKDEKPEPKKNKKLEVIADVGYIYSSSIPYVGIVHKSGEHREIVSHFGTCKDFLHEDVALVLNAQKKKARTTTQPDFKDFDFDSIRVLMYFNTQAMSALEVKEGVYKLKRVVNEIEKAAGWKRSLISSVTIIGKHDNKKVTVPDKELDKAHTLGLMFTGDGKYFANMPALHTVLFIFRMLYPVANMLEAETHEALIKLISELAADNNNMVSKRRNNIAKGSDAEYISALLKTVQCYLIPLMKGHDKIFEGLSLYDCYSPESVNATGYHGGFGMAAMVNNKMFVPTVNDRIEKHVLSINTSKE